MNLFNEPWRLARPPLSKQRLGPACPAGKLAPAQKRHGFTFIEVLATLTLLSIVLPSIMSGISLSMKTSILAKQQSQAASLAHGKLMELATDSQWQHAALSGDFGQDWPEYRWSASVSDWDAALQQVQMTVTWQFRNQQRSVVLTTLMSSSETTSGLASAQ